MFLLIESTSEKRKLQQKFRWIFQKRLKPQGKRTIGYPGGHTEESMFADGTGGIWYSFSHLTETAVKKYWNPFDIFDPNRSVQTIVVELNIPIDTNGQQVAGFFARNIESGLSYLMHTGRVGGGRPGIGKSAFLAWSKLKPMSVLQGDGQERFGIVIGAMEENEIVERVSSFVSKVSKFKELVAAGDLDTPDFRRQVEEFERYSPEFSGRKKGDKGRVSDYISYHGDIVDALYKKRHINKREDETIINSSLIDLCVKRRGQIIEVYEVKTNAERQTLYTACGQLIIHSGGDESVRKVMVLPKEEKLPDDVEAVLKAIKINIWRFTLNDDKSISFTIPQSQPP